MDRKGFFPVAKQVSEGSALVVFATLNVKDKDGDVTLPGFFGDQVSQVIGAHNWQSVPLGKARIFERDAEALAELKFNMETQAGRDWHSALKFDLAHPPARQEYSYGFSIKAGGSRPGDFNGEPVRYLQPLEDGSPGVTVHEVSPVLLGAGVATRTLEAKGEKAAVPSHSTETDTGAWDGAVNERRVRSGEAASYYRRIYAWQDSEGDVGAKTSWRFIHHFVDGSGAPGAASTRACSSAIAVLNGGRGGTTIPAADKPGVWRHLARHLRDSGAEPPELAGAELPDSRFADQIAGALEAVTGLKNRAAEILALRAAEGRGLGSERAGSIRAILDELKRAGAELDVLLREPVSRETADALFADFERRRFELRGLVD